MPKWVTAASAAAKPYMPYVFGATSIGVPLANKIYQHLKSDETTPTGGTAKPNTALNPDVVPNAVKENAKSGDSSTNAPRQDGLGSGTGASPEQVKENLKADPNSSGRAYGVISNGTYRNATGRANQWEDPSNSDYTKEIVRSQVEAFNKSGIATAKQHSADIEAQLSDRNSPLYRSIDRTSGGRLTDWRLQNELIQSRYDAQVKEKERLLREQLKADGISPKEPVPPEPVPAPAPISQSEAQGGMPNAPVGPQEVKYAAGAEQAMANGWNGVSLVNDVKANAGLPETATDTSTESETQSDELTAEQLDPNHPDYVGHAAAAAYYNRSNDQYVKSQPITQRAADTAQTVMPWADDAARIVDSVGKHGWGNTLTARGNVSGLNSPSVKGAGQRVFGTAGKGVGAAINKGMVGLNLYEAGADVINELTGKDYSLFSQGKFGEDSGMKGLRGKALDSRLGGATEALGNNLTAGGYDAVRANLGVIGDLPMPRSWSQAIKKNANAYTAERGGVVNADPFGSGRLMESLAGQVFDAIDEWKYPRPKKPAQSIQPAPDRVVANNTTYGGSNFRAY